MRGARSGPPARRSPLRLLPREPAARSALGHAMAAALVDVRGGRSGRSVPLENFFGIRLAVVLRPVTETIRIGVVEPRARIVRNAVDDLEAQVRFLDADRDELSHVAPADPDGEAAPVDRRAIHVADAHAEHLHAVAVRG